MRTRGEPCMIDLDMSLTLPVVANPIYVVPGANKCLPCGERRARGIAQNAYLLRPEVPIRRIRDIEHMHKQIQMAAFTLERKALHKPHIAFAKAGS
jgi:hypothetical protein